MSMRNKLITAIVALSLVLCCLVGGTVAWLVTESEVITNTFTVGDINISLAETTGNTFKIIPGATVEKNPIITVEAKSENCYLYVLIDNTVVLNGTVVATPDIDTTNWEVVATKGTKTLYRYKEVVAYKENAQMFPVFNYVTYSNTILKDNISTLNNTTIVVKAYAHQSENLERTTADTNAMTWAGVNN